MNFHVFFIFYFFSFQGGIARRFNKFLWRSGFGKWESKGEDTYNERSFFDIFRVLKFIPWLLSINETHNDFLNFCLKVTSTFGYMLTDNHM